MSIIGESQDETQVGWSVCILAHSGSNLDDGCWCVQYKPKPKPEPRPKPRPRRRNKQWQWPIETKGLAWFGCTIDNLVQWHISWKPIKWVNGHQSLTSSIIDSPSTTSLTVLVFGSRETHTRVWKNTPSDLYKSSHSDYADNDYYPLQGKEYIIRGRNKLLTSKLDLKQRRAKTLKLNIILNIV